MNEDDPLPPWLLMQTPNPVVREALREMLANPQFKAAMDSTFAPAGQMPFNVHVGDAEALRKFNANRQKQVRTPKGAGAVSIWDAQPDSAVHSGAMFIDVDRIHKAAPDSAAAKVALRDAILHEIGHLAPMAGSRHLRDQLGDPKPGENAAEHPIIKEENRLRALLQLPAKAVYGLLEGKR